MYLLFDIGGTKTRVAISRDEQTCTEPVKFDTPEDFEEGIALIARHCKELCGGEAVTAAGGGIAGALNEDRSVLVNAPNVSSNWINKPLKERLEEELQAPVYLENDTAIVGLGEAHSGAGETQGIMVYITVSTGVGGVRITDGTIDSSEFGFEIGHQIIDVDETACPDCTVCPVCNRVDLEGMISGSATQRRFNKKPYEIPQEDGLWDELARWLAVGLNNTIVHWSPRVIVLGGSMMVGDPNIPLGLVEKHMHEVLTIFPQKPTLRPAQLKDIGGIYGALAFVRQQHAMIS